MSSRKFIAVHDSLFRRTNSKESSVVLENSTGGIKVFNNYGCLWITVQVENYFGGFEVNVVTDSNDIVPDRLLEKGPHLQLNDKRRMVQFSLKLPSCQHFGCTCFYIVASWFTPTNTIISLVSSPLIAFSKYNIVKQQKQVIYSSFVSILSYESIQYTTQPSIKQYIQTLQCSWFLNYIVHHKVRPNVVTSYSVVAEAVAFISGEISNETFVNGNNCFGISIIEQTLEDEGDVLKSVFGVTNKTEFRYRRNGARITGQLSADRSARKTPSKALCFDQAHSGTIGGTCLFPKSPHSGGKSSSAKSAKKKKADIILHIDEDDNDVAHCTSTVQLALVSSTDISNTGTAEATQATNSAAVYSDHDDKENMTVVVTKRKDKASSDTDSALNVKSRIGLNSDQQTKKRKILGENQNIANTASTAEATDSSSGTSKQTTVINMTKIPPQYPPHHPAALSLHVNTTNSSISDDCDKENRAVLLSPHATLKQRASPQLPERFINTNGTSKCSNSGNKSQGGSNKNNNGRVVIGAPCAYIAHSHAAIACSPEHTRHNARLSLSPNSKNDIFSIFLEDDWLLDDLQDNRNDDISTES